MHLTISSADPQSYAPFVAVASLHFATKASPLCGRLSLGVMCNKPNIVSSIENVSLRSEKK